MVQADMTAKAAYQHLAGLFNAGRYQDVLQSVEKLDAQVARSFNIQLIQATSLTALGQFDAAIKQYRALLEVTPDHADVMNNLGVALRRTGRLPEAADLYRQLLKIRPNSVETIYNLAVTHDSLGDAQSAAKFYEDAIALRPNFPDAYNNLAILKDKAGRTDDAVALYRKAVQLNPNYAEAWNNLGVALGKRRDLDSAVECYRTAIKINKKYAEAWHNAAATLQQLERFDGALECAQNAVTLKPKNAEFAVTLGTILAQHRKVDDAVAAFRNAVAADSHHALAREKLAFYLHMSGKTAEGDDQYQLLSDQTCKNDEERFFAKTYNAGAVLTHTFPLVKRRARFQSLVTYFQQALPLNGEVAECGCFRGLSAFILSNYWKRFDPNFEGEGFHIFDSFEGLSRITEIDQKGRPGEFACDEETVRRNLAAFPNIRYYPGWIPRRFSEVENLQFKFLNLDVDLYEPTSDSIAFFFPRLVPGGVIVCDDYNWPGAKAAIEKMREQFKFDVALTPHNQAIIVKT